MDAHVRRFLSLSRVCKLSSCRCPDRLEWAVLDDADGGAWAYARGVLPGLVFGGVCCTLRQSTLTLEEHAIKSRKFYIDPPNQELNIFDLHYIYIFHATCATLKLNCWDCWDLTFQHPCDPCEPCDPCGCARTSAIPFSPEDPGQFGMDKVRSPRAWSSRSEQTKIFKNITNNKHVIM